MSNHVKPQSNNGSVRSNIERMRELSRQINRLNELIYGSPSSANGARSKQPAKQ